MRSDGDPPRPVRDDAVPAGLRVTPLGGCPNFRHLGGYRALGGRITRADRLFRSGWLHLEADAEKAAFENLGIDRVFDFRNEAETAAKPFVLPGLTTSDVVALPIQHGSMAGFLQALAAGATSPADTRRAMATMYREMIGLGAQQFRSFLGEAALSEGPLLLACSLGKDRTGVASALLLAALGVDEADIFGDFLISNLVYRDLGDSLYCAMSFAARGIPLELVRDVLTVHPDYLAAAWEEIKSRHGSVESYLRQDLGLSDEVRARLMEIFTQ